MTEPAVIEYGSASAAALQESQKQASVPLYRNRTFAAVYAGNTLSVLGEGFHSIAIGYWVLSTTGSAQAMAAVMLPQMIVGLLLGAIAGTLADRHNRRMIMIAMDVARAVLMLGVAAIIFGMPGQGVWMLLPLLTLANVASQFHGPAFQSSLIFIVGHAQVGRATGLMQVTDTLARLGGLALGGVAVAMLGAAWAMLVVGAMYVLSGICVALGGRFPNGEGRQAADRTGFWTDFRDGLTFIRANALSRSIMLLLPSVMIIFVASMMLFQVMAVTVWHATPRQFGLLEAAIPVGYACGSGLMLLLHHRTARRGWWICASVLLAGPNLYALSIISSVHAALPFAFGIGFILSIGTVLIMIALRTETAAEYQGRVFGTLGAMTNLASPIGVIVTGMLSDRFGADRIMAMNGIVLTLAALLCVLLLKPIRSYR